MIVDRSVALGYCRWMRRIKNIIGLALLITAVGCGGGGTPEAKTASDTQAVSGGKEAECEAIGTKLKALEDAVKGHKGMAAGRALMPALEKLKQDLSADPISTPELKTAVSDLSSEATVLHGKFKEVYVVFEEMEKVNEGLKGWQAKVEKSAEEFDNACGKAPKQECESVSAQVTQIPQLDGDGFSEYAKRLDSFIKATGKLQVGDAGLKTSLKNMLSVLGEAIKPMNRLEELRGEVDKLGPAADDFKGKANKVREICGIPTK